MSNFIIAQIFGILGIIASVLSMQFKKRKHILIALFLLSLFSALNFLFLGNMTSSYICFFAIIEMIINLLFEKKNKDIPKYVVGIYIIVNIALGMITYKSIIDILPIACAIIYCGTIITKNESNIRKLMLTNQSIWLVFDIIVKAYTFSVSNILTIISTIIGMYRYDYKKNNR